MVEYASWHAVDGQIVMLMLPLSDRSTCCERLFDPMRSIPMMNRMLASFNIRSYENKSFNAWRSFYRTVTDVTTFEC